MPRALLFERLVVQQRQRQLACALVVPLTVLVMHGEGFGRILLERTDDRASALQLENPPPRASGLLETAVASQPHAAPIERFADDVRGRAAIGGRVIEAGQRAIDRAGTLVHLPEREGLGRIAAAIAAALDELHGV